MDLYGRPAPRRTLTPAVAFLNERPKSVSFSSGFKPSINQSREEDGNFIPDRSSSNQLQQNLQPPPLLHQRPASSRFLNRPQSTSGVRRPDAELAVPEEAKQRPRTARDGGRTSQSTKASVKRAFCVKHEGETTSSSEVGGKSNEELPEASTSPLDEQYLEQLKADILYLHFVHRRLEIEVNEIEKRDRYPRTSTSQAPNHVKNLLLHRDTKAYLGWSSQRNMDLNSDSGPVSTASIHTQLLRYNYSSNPAQLTAAKVGLEEMLSDTLISLMEFCLAHNSFGSCESFYGSGGLSEAEFSTDDFKLTLARPPTRQQKVEKPLPFGNGCGTSSASIYAGGILSVLQQTEVLRRTILACIAEKNNLIKVIADKDTQLNHLTEQIGFFKDVLASRRPQFERFKKVHAKYEERETSNAPETENPESSQDSAQPKSTLATEHLARLASLEKDRVESILQIQTLERQRDELEQQLENANFETQTALDQLRNVNQRHDEAMISSNNSHQEQVDAMEIRLSDLQSSLASTVERYRSLEMSTSEEKAQLRRDKQELENLIRRKNDETGQRQTHATAKAETEAKSAAAQLKLVAQQLIEANQALAGLQVQLKEAQGDNKQAQGIIRRLHHDLKVWNEESTSLASKLVVANTAIESKSVLLQQSESRLETAGKEIERQQTLLDGQTLQIQSLEAKLSRSVPIDDEELQSRQQREESAWHQRVSALEHALVAERQNTALFREQQRKAVAMEQERAAHAVEQAQAVTAELAAANLCLLERKRQREQEQLAFEAKLKKFADRIADISSTRDALERELGSLRSQHEQLQLTKEQAVATEKKLLDEVASMKAELKSLTEIRENLDRALAHALASPKAKSARHQASLSELRAEFQKAKQKINTLEEQVSRSGSIRTNEIDGKLSQLSARERRTTEEQRGLKKQRTEVTTERCQLQMEQAELSQQRELQLLAASKQKTDHDLLQQIIVLLAQRLQVLVALFDTAVLPDLPPNEASNEESLASAALSAQAKTYVDSWREIRHRWKKLRQELDHADWKLVDMRSRLGALNLEYVDQPLTPLQIQDGEQRSLSSGFRGPNPFSDAVAAGRDTVPVADQLKASRMLRRLSCPGESLESRARQIKAEEHETFALALAREMGVMKDSYERQLEDLRVELRKTQQLRVLTSQRLRTELAAQRSRSQHALKQLSGRILELQTALLEQEKVLVAVQTQQQAILDQHTAATSDDERQRALLELAELVGGEQRRRDRERLAKLLTYCGASSVTVEQRDESVEQETLDEVLHRIADVEVGLLKMILP